MANKFELWVENNELHPSRVENSTQNYSTFLNDSQRQAGFQSGEPASSIRVNTALRQANLVVCALMDVVAPDNQTVDLQSDREDVAQLIGNKLNILKSETMTHPTIAEFINKVVDLQGKLYRISVKLDANVRTVGRRMAINNQGAISFSDDADLYFYTKKMVFTPTGFGSGSANKFMRLSSMDIDMSSSLHRPMFMEVMRRVNQEVESNMGYIAMGFTEDYSWLGATSQNPLFVYSARDWSYTYSTTNIFQAEVEIQYFNI